MLTLVPRSRPHLVVAAKGHYTGFTNRKKTEVTIEELYQKIPEAKWLKVTGGQLDVLDSAYISFLGEEPTSLYIPSFPTVMKRKSGR